MQEIKISSEDPNADLSEAYWADLAIQSSQERMKPWGDRDAFPLDAFTCDMFLSTWAPMMQAICSVLDNCSQTNLGDVLMIERCVAGLGSMGKLAVQYEMVEVVDALMIMLSGYVQVLHVRPTSKAILAFSRSLKAKESFKLMFKELVHKCGNNIEQGWRQVLDVMVMLVKLEVWSGNVLRVVGFVETGQITPNRVKSFSQNMKRVSSSNNGIGNALGSLSQMWVKGSLFNEGDGEAEQEAVQVCKKVVEACRIGDILQNSKFLSDHSLLQFVTACVLHGTSAGTPPNTVSSWISPANRETQSICMDILVNLIIRNSDRAMLLWPHVSEYCQYLIQTTSLDDASFSLIDKAVRSLFIIQQRLLPVVQEDQESSDQVLVVMSSLLLMEPIAMAELSVGMSSQLGSLIASVGEFIRTQSQWELICGIIRFQFESCIESKNAILQLLIDIVSTNDRDTSFF
eukprot:TRINITY_DN24214_c0_g2_i1.p1 TRINITY_DN24214_c0_g2~~TRINITY_DN24214_c0_g2_i1.p1  ORF type:complete len:491 (+),score=81.85 TRINITY_DN24214_c0_g2_i1:100-1473(+)